MEHPDPTTYAVIGAKPICTACKSDTVQREASALWNPLRGRWELNVVFDKIHCSRCNSETTFDWQIDKVFRKKRIQRLNDAFRRGEVLHGSVMITEGVQAFGPDVVATLLEQVALFTDFSEVNDPHHEHDFGSIEVDHEKVFWKIDCFDRDLKWHSPDAANPEVTHRVLTVMLAIEY